MAAIILKMESRPKDSESALQLWRRGMAPRPLHTGSLSRRSIVVAVKVYGRPPAALQAV